LNHDFILQLIANGLSVGLGYALAAVGLALLFGILEQVNFAHGELYTVGAFILWWFAAAMGLPYGAAVMLAVGAMACAGFVFARVALVPTLNRSSDAVILATLAVSVVLQNVVRLVFGATPRSMSTPLEGTTVVVGGILLFGQRLLVAASAVVTFLGLTAFLRFTEIGRAMRAMAQNKQACVMVGIDVRRITGWTAAISAAMTGFAAAMIAPLFDLYPSMGTDVVFKSFAVVIIGGMGNIVGAAVAGIALGVAEGLASGYLGTAFKDGIAFAAMILILLVRPHGLFGRTVRV
jgi:branched-chain amino acid transport system permease protein